MILAVATFVVTSLIVGAIGYLLLLRGPDPRDDNASPSDDNGRSRALQAKMVHTINWLRAIRGEEPLTNAMQAASGPPPGLGLKLLLAAVFIAISVAIFLGVIAVMLQLFRWTVYPVLDAAAPLVWSMFLREGGAELLALLVLIVGMPLARRFRRPGRFRAGAILIALSLVTFWPMQRAAASMTFRFWEYNAILHVLGLLMSVTLLAAGLEAMRRAVNTPEQDSFED